MNWGYRITLLTLGFICFMTFMVISAFRQNFDLVTEDYYGKELKFQEQIEKSRNQQQLKTPVICTVSDQEVMITFPGEFSGKIITGEILFFCPSDAKKDFTSAITTIDGIQAISKKRFSKSLYKVQLDYHVGEKKYYAEQSIMIR